MLEILVTKKCLIELDLGVAGKGVSQKAHAVITNIIITIIHYYN